MENTEVSGGLQGSLSAEGAARQDVSLLTAVFSSVPCVRFIVVDNEGRFVSANPDAEARLGRSPIGSTLAEVFEPAHAAEMQAFVNHVLTSRESCVTEGMLAGVWTRMSFCPLAPAPDGRALVAIICTAPCDLSKQCAERGPYFRWRHDDFGPLAALTERELEVLRLIGRGLSSAEIAKLMHRSTKTVEWHRASLGVKLKADSRIELARIAIGSGLTSLDDREFGKLASKRGGHGHEP